jgi:hypothetical protein
LTVRPLLALLLGSGAGGWFCADGAQCRPAAALACCCGCPEGANGVAHRCVEAGAAVSGDHCGCFYRTQTLDVAAHASPRFLTVGIAALPAACVPSPAIPPVVYALVSPLAHGPPGRFLSPGDPRGPPA